MNERRWIVGASGGAVGLGGVALAFGACCVAPWAVSLLGIAGAVALARLSFLQPYVLGGVVALLGVAFWFAYRPQPVCADGTCAQNNQRRLRWVVWLAAMAALGLAAASYAPLFLNQGIST